jgi:multiple sugar transport system ATP-binding protein
MASVTLDAVSKRYPGAVTAVDDLSLHIREGEFIVFVGPSGCGKTTTLRMIAGLESVTAGHIRLGDADVTSAQPKDRDVAMVFQDYALYPHMTARQNMGFGLRMRGVPSPVIAERVHAAAKTLSIESLLDRMPDALSGGQQQRVAVGRAIVREPQAFLFDEPLSNLDAQLRVQMRTELARLHARLGTTTVYVTHDQTEAMTLGDRLVVMREGRVQQIDPPLTLYNQPANRFVASFMGSPPMNLLEGRIVRADGLRFQMAAGNLSIHLGPLSEAIPPSAIDTEVTLGIRPEHIHLESGPPDAPVTTIDVTTDVVEPLGNELLVHAHLSGRQGTLSARTPATYSVSEGESVSFALNLRHLHLFDQSSGQALPLRRRVPTT